MEMTKDDFLALKDYKKEGLRTGFFDFDIKDFIGKKDYVVLAGGTGSGKSAVAIFMACSMAKAGHKVVYINAENAPHTFNQAILDFGFNHARDFGEYDKNGLNRFVIINDKIPFESLSHLITLHNADCLFIDTWKSLILRYENVNLQTTMSAKFADELGKTNGLPSQLNCCVISTHQLTKEGAKIGRPTIGDIQGSASIGEQAHKIILCWRASKNSDLAFRNEDKMEYQSEIFTNSVELQIAKEREGLIKSITYTYRKTRNGYLKLNQWEREEYRNLVFPQNKGWKK